MDGKYLASNIGPLKVIGDGKVFIEINDMLNTNRFEDVRMVAYSIHGYDSRIVTIGFLFKNINRSTLYFRDFDFYKRTGNIDDHLRLTTNYGAGITDFSIEDFLELRDFYFQNITASEIAQ